MKVSVPDLVCKQAQTRKNFDSLVQFTLSRLLTTSDSQGANHETAHRFVENVVIAFRSFLPQFIFLAVTPSDKP